MQSENDFVEDKIKIKQKEMEELSFPFRCSSFNIFGRCLLPPGAEDFLLFHVQAIRVEEITTKHLESVKYK